MSFINKLASFTSILGLVAIVAGLFNRMPNILKWMDRWGDYTSWLIKIGLVAGGGLMWFVTRPRGLDEDDDSELKNY